MSAGRSEPSPVATADIGVVGMAVMGSNLARNLAHHGYTVAVYNRTRARTEEVVRDHGGEGRFVPAADVGSFVESLKRPRRIILMVKAGAATDATIQSVLPHLEAGDIVMDGGNSHFLDTIRREGELSARGLHFVGSGISGGEEGALTGPSIMPGGTAEAYASLGPMLETISAHVDGVPCCTHVGPDGAGHFVKMVHNGIEYADMQLIGESYDLLRRGLGASPAELADVFAQWNAGDLESFLIEITAEVLRHVDAGTGRPFVDVVLDRAGQKGTGKWTVQTALDLGVPVTGIAEATFARALSSQSTQREVAREVLPRDAEPWDVTDRDAFVTDVRQALYASKVVAYSQGFDEIAAASAEHGWDIDRGAMARIWRGGCIIRAQFLNRITEAYERDPGLTLLLADPYFADIVGRGLSAWRRVVAQAALHGVPTPAFASSLAYYDGLVTERSTAALIQGQRDLFGAHTYQRVDRPGVFHTLWTGDRTEIELA
ncbi:NADP-dependent phosphogluconate dehydrogenase [Propionicicella superfundia]|uniref:NADP-dependent phosphogluconate dehydrogenase n=1 Tax=Propionicicella superfundia TaxID=348582 RepID=UPI0004141551|nr:NADP-dependent phosphogluconate dehydrogenase [Propionicicella superfundia]